MKYMGGKARLAKDILSIVLKDRKVNQLYIEPFCGGCNVIDKVSGLRLANDSNYYLVEMWKKLVNENWIPEKISKDEYQQIKDNKSDFPAWLVGWAAFNCSYSGKYFGGFAGETKTKEGIRDYQQEAINNVLKQIPLLKNVDFVCSNYLNLDFPKNSIVYCDPPYDGTTGYFDSFDHVQFWDWVREKSRSGHQVYVSEYKAPADFECVYEKKVNSSLS